MKRKFDTVRVMINGVECVGLKFAPGAKPEDILRPEDMNTITLKGEDGSLVYVFKMPEGGIK